MPRLIFFAVALRLSDGCPSRMDIRDYRGRALVGLFDFRTLRPGQARRVAKARVSVMSERHQSGGSAGGAGTELRGTIKWFNPEKGYGFVSPADGSPDVFLHISALKQAGLQDAPEGSTIHCEVGQGRKGVQVLRVIQLDASTAAPRQPTQQQQRPRRPFPPRGNSPHHGHE